jgi:septum formation protein
MNRPHPIFQLRHPLVLASESPRREQILRMLGFDFSVAPSGIEETVPPDLKPEQVTETLARLKALQVSRERQEALVIGADTLVVLDNHILGKPSKPGEALEMLRFLSGRTHLVFTGVALARAGTVIGAGVECSEVTFAAWGDAELKAYIQSGEPMDKAGAYAIQGRGAFLVEGIRGCFFNVMGLPVQMTLRLLSQFRAT